MAILVTIRFLCTPTIKAIQPSHAPIEPTLPKNVIRVVQCTLIVPKVHDVHLLRHDRRYYGGLHGQLLGYDKTFDHCLRNLDQVLQRCKERT
jgi:hypothetical protein